MEEFIKANQALWDEWTGINAKSKFYDVDGFKAGRLTIDDIEREGVGDMAGKSLLHLQCHFGMSTLSFARLGAKATGADFSEKAIALARSLSAELDIPAEFVQANIYDLPNVLEGQFDIVFTSYGVLTWLPDMKGWAEVIAHFLKPGGRFFIVEAHPFARVFDDESNAAALNVIYPYFHSPEPQMWDVEGSYTDPEAHVEQDVEYEWQHSMGDIINALIGAGLRIEELREYDHCVWSMLRTLMDEVEPGVWRLKEGVGDIPLMFSIKATK